MHVPDNPLFYSLLSYYFTCLACRRYGSCPPAPAFDLYISMKLPVRSKAFHLLLFRKRFVIFPIFLYFMFCFTLPCLQALPIFSYLAADCCHSPSSLSCVQSTSKSCCVYSWFLPVFFVVTSMYFWLIIPSNAVLTRDLDTRLYDATLSIVFQ